MRALIAIAAGLALAGPAQAVVIMDSTWRTQGGDEAHWTAGFAAHDALGAAPQFSAMVAISLKGDKDFGTASGTWIGNADGKAYVLTAAHVMDDEAEARTTYVRTRNGAVVRAERAFVHPRWRDGGAAKHGGFDIAILRLEAPIEGMGAPATLYGGTSELGARAVIVGYGTHGVAPYGHGHRFGPRAGDAPTAAENVIDVATPVTLEDARDWGNLLEIDMDEAGEGKNRYGAGEPVSALEGILAPGDSGGALWIRTAQGWRVAGVNSSGDPGADYQDASQFARVSSLRAWITLAFAEAQFGE